MLSNAVLTCSIKSIRYRRLTISIGKMRRTKQRQRNNFDYLADFDI